MVVGCTDHLPGGAAPNWVSPKQGSGPMARHAVISPPPLNKTLLLQGRKERKKKIWFSAPSSLSILSTSRIFSLAFFLPITPLERGCSPVLGRYIVIFIIVLKSVFLYRAELLLQPYRRTCLVRILVVIYF